MLEMFAAFQDLGESDIVGSTVTILAPGNFS